MEATATMDFVPMMREITTSYEAGAIQELLMHDGSAIRLHKLAKEWDPMNRNSAMNAIHHAKRRGEILTGLLFIDEGSNDLHGILNTTEQPLNSLRRDTLSPGSEVLKKLNASLR